MPTVLEFDDFLIAHKPPGVASHRPSPDHLGFIEWLSLALDKPLWPCHRLDKETSGIMVFAKSKSMAGQFGELFANHQVQKEYLLVSDCCSAEEKWVVEQGVEGAPQQSEHPHEEGWGIPSTTVFERLSRIESSGKKGSRLTFYLYKAKPLTGKTHQIRQHATRSKIPILGDTLYGGSPFPRLMLHSLSLDFEIEGRRQHHEFAASRLFARSDWLCDPQLAQWVVGFERREVLFPDLFKSNQALRLLHRESPDLRVDQFGAVLQLGWWQESEPSIDERHQIGELLEAFGFEHWQLQARPNAQWSQPLQCTDKTPMDWLFNEGERHYLGRRDQGQNFGLFLDQREQRHYLQANAKDKSVLNLFAYTCGFSLAAALGGAKKVVSVDSSKKYLEWGKQNFLANSLDPEAYEFRAIDSFSYLKFAKKNNLQFDWIVCDPPSFSRDKKTGKSFKINRDYSVLLEVLSEILAPSGTLHFSSNYEDWSYTEWRERLAPILGPLGLTFEPSPPSQWDFEWQAIEANLKIFLLKKA